MLVVLALVVALGAAAYANGGSCTITVNNAMQGETYTAYKMLDVSVNSDYSSYAYILDTKVRGMNSSPPAKEKTMLTSIN